MSVLLNNPNLNLRVMVWGEFERGYILPFPIPQDSPSYTERETPLYVCSW